MCVCVRVAQVAAPDGKGKVDDYWEPAKKSIWGDPRLLDNLLHYDKDRARGPAIATLPDRDKQRRGIARVVPETVFFARSVRSGRAEESSRASVSFSARARATM